MGKFIPAIITFEFVARQKRNPKEAGGTVIPVNMIGTTLRTDKIKLRIRNRVFYFQRILLIIFVILKNLLSFFLIIFKDLKLYTTYSL